jgi:hypothetical protein
MRLWRLDHRQSAGLATVIALSVLTAGTAAPAAQAHASAPPQTAAAPDFAAPYLDGVSGLEPARTMSLAGTWGFTPLMNTTCTGGGAFGTTTGPLTCVDSPASGQNGTIQVPGGGWLKQGHPDVSKAIYSRVISVPRITDDQVTRINFGAVNHRATLAVDGRTVATQVTSYTASVFDISAFVKPGSTHRIDVTVEGRNALVGTDGRYTVPEGASWSNDVAQGIFRSADLEVLPAVHIADTVVRTSVKDRTVSYDAYVTNSSRTAQTVSLTGKLSSWNHAKWDYPSVPKTKAVVPAGQTVMITVGPLKWQEGQGSYWWPNVPYVPGYRAQLHDLDLTVSTSAGSSAAAHVRFGFREIKQVGDHYELNGTQVNFRGDSLQGANYDNIDYHGISDAYDTLPGFLKPGKNNGGWPQAVDNYQRLNYNGVRIHQIPATPYMLDVADEMGLMIQDETAIRGSNNRENFVTGRDNMVKHLADLVRRDRNHASVLRWSQANEPNVQFFVNPGAGPEFDETLYQTVMKLDTTRPISTDGDSSDLPHDNYTVFCHYYGFSFGQYNDSICDGPAGKPQGQGEFLWYGDNSPQGMNWFATATMQMREKGADEARPYTLLDVWASLIPGVKRSDMSLESGYPNGAHPLYGQDNLRNPWSNPNIQLIQKAFNPVAAIDTQFWDANKLSNAQGAWPAIEIPVPRGSLATRTLTLFNDTFQGKQLRVSWEIRSGSPAGKKDADGQFSADVPLGGHLEHQISFMAPKTQDRLYLVLSVSKPGQGVLFADASTSFS